MNNLGRFVRPSEIKVSARNFASHPRSGVPQKSRATRIASSTRDRRREITPHSGEGFFAPFQTNRLAANGTEGGLSLRCFWHALRAISVALGIPAVIVAVTPLGGGGWVVSRCPAESSSDDPVCQIVICGNATLSSANPANGGNLR